VTCCSGNGQKWIIGLMSAMSQKADIQSTYEVCWGGGLPWKVSRSTCRLHVIILSATQVYQFYEMCQVIMNNPVLNFTIVYQQYTSYPTSLRSILTLPSHLHIGLPSGLFRSDFPTKILYVASFQRIYYLSLCCDIVLNFDCET
jgi:hypothetical protein